MLVLSRKVGEKVIIGGNITVTVVAVDGHRVRLGFDAPENVRIVRSELTARPAHTDHDPDLAAKPAEWRVARTDRDLALSR